MGLTRWGGRWGLAALAVFVAVGVAIGGPTASPVQSQETAPTLEWFGWSNFRLTAPNGKVIFINPFINGNPDAAISVDDIQKADLILAADGHGDEIGSTMDIAQKTGAMVIAPAGVLGWFLEKGLPAAQVPQRFALPGNVYKMDGVTVRVVNSIHSSELPQPTTANAYGGVATGFVITFDNGYTIYFSGSSAATSDMALWAQMYKPDLMIFHMSGQHEPMDIAMSIKLTMTDNPNLKMLMPHHHRVNQQPGQTWFTDVRAALDNMGISLPITEQVRSEVYTLTK
jgi:L-ascorbate metabolism protein UlaG (beta-lactamase superfamily)